MREITGISERFGRSAAGKGDLCEGFLGPEHPRGDILKASPIPLKEITGISERFGRSAACKGDLCEGFLGPEHPRGAAKGHMGEPGPKNKRRAHPPTGNSFKALSQGTEGGFEAPRPAPFFLRGARGDILEPSPILCEGS